MRVAAWLLCGLVVLVVAPRAGADDFPTALRQLQALNSVADAGLPLDEYQRRVLDAKIIVDRYLARPDPNQRRRIAVAKAMGLYVIAASAWRYSITGTNPPGLQKEDCPPAGYLMAYAVRRGGETLTGKYFLEFIQSSHKTLVPRYWSCASGWTLAAEGGPDPPDFPPDTLPVPTQPAARPPQPRPDVTPDDRARQRRYECERLGGSACN